MCSFLSQNLFKYVLLHFYFLSGSLPSSFPLLLTPAASLVASVSRMVLLHFHSFWSFDCPLFISFHLIFEHFHLPFNFVFLETTFSLIYLISRGNILCGILFICWIVFYLIFASQVTFSLWLLSDYYSTLNGTNSRQISHTRLCEKGSRPE